MGCGTTNNGFGWRVAVVAAGSDRGVFVQRTDIGLCSRLFQPGPSYRIPSRVSISRNHDLNHQRVALNWTQQPHGPRRTDGTERQERERERRKWSGHVLATFGIADNLEPFALFLSHPLSARFMGKNFQQQTDAPRYTQSLDWTEFRNIDALSLFDIFFWFKPSRHLFSLSAERC
jgi:hypothetical protein